MRQNSLNQQPKQKQKVFQQRSREARLFIPKFEFQIGKSSSLPSPV